MASENPKYVEYVEIMLNHDEVMTLKNLVCDTMEEGLMKNNLINALAHGLLRFGSSHNAKIKAE